MNSCAAPPRHLLVALRAVVPLRALVPPLLVGRVQQLHRRRGAEAVGERPDEPLGDGVGVVELGLAAGDAEAHRRSPGHEALPREEAGLALEVAEGGRVELPHPNDDAARRAEPEVGAVEVLGAPGEGDAASLGARVGDADRAQLRLGERLEPRGGDREELEAAVGGGGGVRGAAARGGSGGRLPGRPPALTLRRASGHWTCSHHENSKPLFEEM